MNKLAKSSMASAGFAALLLAATPVAFAQDNSSNSLSGQDRTFLEKAAQGASYEQDISKMAAQRSKNSNIRQYANMVVSDHAHSKHELQQIAVKYNVDLQMAPTQKDQTRINDLKDMSGKSFDQAYLQDMKQANGTDLQAETQEANNTNNGQLRQFAQQSRSTDQKHEQDAQSLSQDGSANG